MFKNLLQWYRLQGSGWLILLDLFIIAIGIYLLYRTLRTSGSLKVLVGILIASGIFVVANYLGLRGITWIYSNLSSIVLIALIIIFQPELRKILERTASIYRKEARRGDDLAGVISDAVLELAARRWGALIVFPGVESVEGHTAGGVMIDGIPSEALLQSIFDPHSRGHDGAMILRNGRIESIGVRLPISETGRLPDEYGTRHHAAMGLCEVTDAMVLLVSEERGRLSIFKKGAMYGVKNRAEVEAAILGHWDSIGFNTEIIETKRKRWLVFGELGLALIFAAIIRVFLVPNDPGIRYAELPVLPQLIGSLPATVVLDRVEVRPEKIKVFLPPRFLKENLLTSPIYLDDIHETTHFNLNLLIPPDANPVAGYWPEVEVEIFVRQIGEEPTDTELDEKVESPGEGNRVPSGAAP